MYRLKDKKLNPILIKKYISYLDWIELVLLSNKMEDKITVLSAEVALRSQNEEKEIVNLLKKDEKHE